MNQQLIDLSYEWWIKLTPLCRKFARETYICGLSQEDLMQECYLQLVKCLERFDSSLSVPFESYYKIQLYGWRANQNRKKREILSFGDEMYDAVARQPDESVNIEKEIGEKLLIEAVAWELSHMKSEERDVVTGYYVERKSLKQIAKELDIKYKTAEFRKSQAIKKLKSLMEGYY